MEGTRSSFVVAKFGPTTTKGCASIFIFVDNQDCQNKREITLAKKLSHFL